jgi:hypothetical protein
MKITIITLLIFLSSLCFAQDIITKRSNKEEIKVDITEVSSNSIKYKKFDNPSGPVFVLDNAEIFMIVFKDGTKQYFENDVQESTESMSSKGLQDAKKYYKGQRSGIYGTEIATILTSPLIGLIPAAICVANEPKDENLKYPEAKLMENREYRDAYIAQAHKTKKKKVWLGYGIGSGFWLLIIIIANSNAAY